MASVQRAFRIIGLQMTTSQWFDCTFDPENGQTLHFFRNRKTNKNQIMQTIGPLLCIFFGYECHMVTIN